MRASRLCLFSTVPTLSRVEGALFVETIGVSTWGTFVGNAGAEHRGFGAF